MQVCSQTRMKVEATITGCRCRQRCAWSPNRAKLQFSQLSRNTCTCKVTLVHIEQSNKAFGIDRGCDLQFGVNEQHSRANLPTHFVLKQNHEVLDLVDVPI